MTPCTALPDGWVGIVTLVRRQITEHNGIAFLKGWVQFRLDVSLERIAVHGVLYHPERGQAITA